MKKRIMSLLLTLVMVMGMAVSLPNIEASAANSDVRNKMIHILYNGKGGYLLCDFDGYGNSYRHEGIDFASYGGYGTAIYSLIDGVVTRSVNSSGSSGLSTCAIYDEANNKTVVYLHANFSVAAGTRVRRGQYIGTEANNGTGTPHTHVEVRNGRQTHASVSNDTTLVNSNPYPYWEKVLSSEPTPYYAYLDVWTSDSAMGDSYNYFNTGSKGYLCYEIYDDYSGKKINDVADISYTADITIYNPNGSVAKTYRSYNDDEDYAEFTPSVEGTYRCVVKITGDINLTEEIYFYAETLSYTVDYDANGGYGEPYYQIKYHGEPLTLSTTKPARTGYTFYGWSTSPYSSTAEYWAGSQFNKNEDTTLYAVWNPITYTVRYNANGGRGTMADSKHTYDSYNMLSYNKYTRAGHEFLGWSTNPNASYATYYDGEYVGNLTSAKGKVVTLYAVWDKNYDCVDSGNCGEGTSWVLNDDGVLTISGTGIVKNYSSPSLVPWNKHASKIKKVVVEEGVTRIGEFAFYGCNNLTSVTLPNSLKEINGYVFKNCSSLTKITLPSGLTKIGDSAFYGTGLTKITIPAAVKSVGYYAFSRCYSLKTVEFLGNAPTIYSNAFNKVTATVNYPSKNSTWTISKKQQYGGALKWTSNGNVDEGLCGSTTSWKLSNDGTLTISGTGIVKNYSSPSLVPWNKYASQIKKVVVEEGVTRIGEFAFYGCANLTSVTLPNSLKEINGYVFKNCSSLTQITLPSGLTKIGDSAFYGTGLTSVVIPSKVNYIGYYAFSRCYSLATVEFKGSAPALCTNVFNKVTATVYYPGSNSTWNSVNWGKLGGTLTPKPKY